MVTRQAVPAPHVAPVCGLDLPKAARASTRGIDRVWTVHLRRGEHRVVIANDLGWPTANALAHELTNLLNTTAQRTGGAID